MQQRSHLSLTVIKRDYPRNAYCGKLGTMSKITLDIKRLHYGELILSSFIFSAHNIILMRHHRISGSPLIVSNTFGGEMPATAENTPAFPTATNVMTMEYLY